MRALPLTNLAEAEKARTERCKQDNHMWMQNSAGQAADRKQKADMQHLPATMNATSNKAWLLSITRYDYAQHMEWCCQQCAPAM